MDVSQRFVHISEKMERVIMLLYDYFESYSVQLSTEQDYFPILNSVVKFFSFSQFYSVYFCTHILRNF